MCRGPAGVTMVTTAILVNRRRRAPIQVIAEQRVSEVIADALPILFVLDRDPKSLAVLLADLSGRFGNDFMVKGETSAVHALNALQEMAAAHEPVALLLVDDAASDLLARAHALHPRAARVLLIDRDYSSTSPAVQAIALGRADYHIVRPWTETK
jgi:thioredoxin reductase (NADPH)